MEPIWLLLLLLELETLQVTAVFVAPLTFAVNWCVLPKPTVELVGEIVTVTFEGGGFVPPLLLLLLLPPPPHPAAARETKMAPYPNSLAYLIETP